MTPPLRPPPPQSLRERARLTLKYLRYLPRTFALVKESSRAFAAGMVALLIGQAALPAAMAWVGKLIVDAVVEAARSGQAAERWHVLRLVGLEAGLMALSTAIYSAAIWAFSLQQILNRAYYALHDTRTPLVWGIVNLSINTIVEIPLIWSNLGEAGMAAGTLASFAIQSVLMLWMLDRRVGGLGLRETAAPVIKMLAASAMMFAACWGVQRLPIYPHGSGKMIWAVQLIVLMTTGGLIYFGACAAMGINVLEHVRSRRVERHVFR